MNGPSIARLLIAGMLTAAVATTSQAIGAPVLRFSNAFGTTVLPITAASLALPAGGQAGVSAQGEHPAGPSWIWPCGERERVVRAPKQRVLADRPLRERLDLLPCLVPS